MWLKIKRSNFLIEAMNNLIFFNLYSLAHQSIFFNNVVIFFAVYFQYVVILLAIIFLLSHHNVLNTKNELQDRIKKWKEIFFVSLSVFLAWISSIFLKIIFHTPRPFLEFPNIIPLFKPTDYAFPSGHSTFFMAVAVAIFLYHKKMGYIFIIFAVLIGISRVIAGVHFPIDIIGGYILGCIISYSLIKLFK
jgi:undecaprenyl-diphosphatase